jgi:hypothetical protein
MPPPCDCAITLVTVCVTRHCQCRGADVKSACSARKCGMLVLRFVIVDASE